MNLISKTINNADVILIALVLNVNVLRFFLNTQETNGILYLMFLTTIIVLSIKQKQGAIKLYKAYSPFKILSQFLLILLTFGFITCTFITQEYATYIKLVIASITGWLCGGLNEQKIKKTYIIFFIINIIYALIILQSPDLVSNYMEGDEVNYLNMTLTLGLCFAFVLVDCIVSIYRNSLLSLTISLGLSVLFFISLMSFAARGVLIFPPLIALFFAFTLGKKHKGKLAIILCLFGILIVGAYIYFLQNASEYAMIHMMGLVENTEDESRLRVWSKAFLAIIDNLWIFWGAGLNGFKTIMDFYPHNIFVHIMADFGIIPFLIFVYVSIKVIQIYYFNNRYVVCKSTKYINIISFTAYLYYLMTFSKSFSFYDFMPLLISTSFCISIGYNTLHHLKRHENKLQYNYSA